MPQIILTQPSGLFANFSTIVDDFTIGDATEEQMREFFLGRTGSDSAHLIDQGIERAKEDAPTWISNDPREDRLGRRFGALQTILVVHGRTRFDEAVKETAGDAAYPAEDLAISSLKWQAESDADRAADALLDSV